MSKPSENKILILNKMLKQVQHDVILKFKIVTLNLFQGLW